METIGCRVKVWGGDGTTYLGEGTYVGDTEVWGISVWKGQECVNILSFPDGHKPTPEEFAGVVPEEGERLEISQLTGNPKLQMDDGTVKYGCQVWWEPIKEQSNATS